MYLVCILDFVAIFEKFYHMYPNGLGGFFHVLGGKGLVSC